MSKSLGTGMNPLAAIEKYGADATRYGLMKMASCRRPLLRGRDRGGRKLANKPGNVSRLILQASEGAVPREQPATPRSGGSSRACRYSVSSRRLLGEFDFARCR
jgi:valyl-tRNA synthetase